MSGQFADIPIVRDVTALRAAVRQWRGEQHTIGFVPTMGALHDGHASLVREAKNSCSRIIASIYINPKQFAPSEDFALYPRDEAGDADTLADAGCHLIYAPTTAVMYPPGFSTSVSVSGITKELEGAARPHFFGGVATVVSKLLIQVSPDKAYFGEKDYQQLLVMRRMAQDLDLPCAVIACPTVREADGLAMSSRNAYLSGAERSIAGKLSATLRETALRVRGGASIASLETDATHALLDAGFTSVDYIAVRDAETLGPPAFPDRPARVLAAAWLGRTRLIDNVSV